MNVTRHIFRVKTSYMKELHRSSLHYSGNSGYTPNAVSKSIAIRTGRRIPIFETAEQSARALCVSFMFYNSMRKRGGLENCEIFAAPGME